MESLSVSQAGLTLMCPNSQPLKKPGFQTCAAKPGTVISLAVGNMTKKQPFYGL